MSSGSSALLIALPFAGHFLLWPVASDQPLEVCCLRGVSFAVLLRVAGFVVVQVSHFKCTRNDVPGSYVYSRMVIMFTAGW